MAALYSLPLLAVCENNHYGLPCLFQNLPAPANEAVALGVK